MEDKVGDLEIFFDFTLMKVFIELPGFCVLFSLDFQPVTVNVSGSTKEFTAAFLIGAQNDTAFDQHLDQRVQSVNGQLLQKAFGYDQIEVLHFGVLQQPAHIFYGHFFIFCAIFDYKCECELKKASNLGIGAFQYELIKKLCCESLLTWHVFGLDQLVRKDTQSHSSGLHRHRLILDNIFFANFD